MEIWPFGAGVDPTDPVDIGIDSPWTAQIPTVPAKQPRLYGPFPEDAQIAQRFHSNVQFHHVSRCGSFGPYGQLALGPGPLIIKLSVIGGPVIQDPAQGVDFQ